MFHLLRPSSLLTAGSSNLRREGARVSQDVGALANLSEDPDPYVRGEAIRRLSSLSPVNVDIVAALIRFAKPRSHRKTPGHPTLVPSNGIWFD